MNNRAGSGLAMEWKKWKSISAEMMKKEGSKKRDRPIEVVLISEDFGGAAAARKTTEEEEQKEPIGYWNLKNIILPKRDDEDEDENQEEEEGDSGKENRLPMMISSKDHPVLMAKVIQDTCNVGTFRLPPDDPRLADVAMKALHKFNADKDTSYELVEVIRGSRTAVAGYGYLVTFVAAHFWESVKVTSLFCANYYDLIPIKNSHFAFITLLRPFYKLSDQGNAPAAASDGNDPNYELKMAAI